MGQGTKRKKYNINANGRFSNTALGGLSCLGGGLRSLRALVIIFLLQTHGPYTQIHTVVIVT